ncbi:MAG: carotenoid biosynthesis protein [Candidatus Helarchaeota archaeon]
MKDENYVYLSLALLVGATIVIILNRIFHVFSGVLFDDVLTILEVFFLLSFTIIHGKLTLGWKNLAIFSTFGIIFTFILETAGIFGLIPGVLWEYHGLKIFPFEIVPIIVPFTWFIYFYCCFLMAHIMVGSISTEAIDEQSISVLNVAKVFMIAIIGGASMMYWDFLNDPVMVARGNWSWPFGGEYFGIPLGNYFGWFSVPFLVFVIIGLLLMFKKENVMFVKFKDDEVSPYTLLGIIPYLLAFIFQSIDALIYNVLYGSFFAFYTMMPMFCLAVYQFFRKKENI